MPSRYSRKLSETYAGITAIAYGIPFLIFAGFFFYVNFLVITNDAQSFFDFVMRRPIFVLIVIGIYILSNSIIAFAGYKELAQPLNLFVTWIYFHQD